MNIKTQGYYLSEPIHWRDDLASLKQEGYLFYILKFEEKKCFRGITYDSNNIDINEILNSKHYGLFEIQGNVIEIIYDQGSKYEMKRVFTILSSDVLLDEHLKEYKFCSFRSNS